MNDIENINNLSENILCCWALTDAKQLGLNACTIATQLLVENEKLLKEKQERENNVCLNCKRFELKDENLGDCTWKVFGNPNEVIQMCRRKDDFCSYFEAKNK